jgi:hypothetical protein
MYYSTVWIRGKPQGIIRDSRKLVTVIALPVPAFQRELGFFSAGWDFFRAVNRRSGPAMGPGRAGDRL